MKYIITSKQYKLLKEEEQEVLHIPSVDLFGGWNNLQEFLKHRGNPPYSIGGDLYLHSTPIKSLGNLIWVGGNFSLVGVTIKSLGNLTSVVGNLNLFDIPTESLGDLTSVGGSLFLGKTQIESLGNLIWVGRSLILRDTPIAKKYTEEQVRNMVSVGGDILF